tara:strand:- start:17711 stop:18343 length:633 start_codon:yes stop_codon:yes gene_type:complete
MKNTLFIVFFILLSSCSSTQFIDSWKNKEIANFEPKKLMVVGMTANLTARKIFEEELQHAFLKRNISATTGSEVFNQGFTESKKSEAEIDTIVSKLAQEGYDAIAITAVIGVDEKTSYYPGYYSVNYRWNRFGRYYYRYQDIYYMPNYYNDYKIYHIETSLYNIAQDETKSLVWVGTFDIASPQNITTTVKDYVARIIKQMEKENVIRKE